MDVNIVKSYNDTAAIANASILTIAAVTAIVASYVDGRNLCGIDFMKKPAVYRIISGNKGKNACACSDLFNAFLYSSAVVALHA
mmetsp:Transcript_14227/g.23211  ORF Transcript_14227/g.23211 Transcript_14227/m.23211 type:complete len:84 (+) Transcript_14227:141-392(+)